jgi:excisionase family DNA binding protein
LLADVAQILLGGDVLPKTTDLDVMEKLSSSREPLLTTEAVAKWLGISTRTVCLWAECREIPAIKIGRQWRFRQGELSEWLQRAKEPSMKNYTHSRAAAAVI